MIYASILFFILSLMTYLLGYRGAESGFSIDSNLMASALLVISVLFFALRYWSQATDNDFLSEY